jgi:hypothetical protein
MSNDRAKVVNEECTLTLECMRDTVVDTVRALTLADYGPALSIVEDAPVQVSVNCSDPERRAMRIHVAGAVDQQIRIEEPYVRGLRIGPMFYAASISILGVSGANVCSTADIRAFLEANLRTLARKQAAEAAAARAHRQQLARAAVEQRLVELEPVIRAMVRDSLMPELVAVAGTDHELSPSDLMSAIRAALVRACV